MGIPGDPGRQRLGLVVVTEGGQIAPREVAAEQFDTARSEHQPKQEPAQQPQTGLRNGRAKFAGRPQSGWREENCQQAGLQKQDVPLIAEEDPADGAQ